MCHFQASKNTGHQKKKLPLMFQILSTESEQVAKISFRSQPITFALVRLGLAGFARLIPGDVYQVTVNHGHQKWRTKGRVGNNLQHWDNDTFLFKSLVGDVFNIKVSASNKTLQTCPTFRPQSGVCASLCRPTCFLAINPHPSFPTLPEHGLPCSFDANKAPLVNKMQQDSQGRLPLRKIGTVQTRQEMWLEDFKKTRNTKGNKRK